MDYIASIGFMAGALATVSFLPQVIHTWKTKKTNDLSLGMYLLFCSGVLMWLVYGFLIQDKPVIAANSITLILALTILFLKLRYS